MKRAFILGWMLAAPFALGAGPSPSPENIEAGRKVYTAKCLRCHPPYAPNEYPAGEWARWMEKMRRKAKLSDGDAAKLSAWADTVRANPSKP